MKEGGHGNEMENQVISRRSEKVMSGKDRVGLSRMCVPRPLAARSCGHLDV